MNNYDFYYQFGYWPPEEWHDDWVVPSRKHDPKAIREALRASVFDACKGLSKVAVSFSAGLDSTILASIARECCDVYGITTKFARSKFNTDYHCAKGSYPKLGIKFHPVNVLPENFPKRAFLYWTMFKTMVESLPYPSANPGLLSAGLVAKRCKSLGIDTLLSGEGADELFGGYRSYRLDNLASRLPIKLGKARRTLLSPGERYATWQGLEPEKAKEFAGLFNIPKEINFTDAFCQTDYAYLIPLAINPRLKAAGDLCEVTIKTPYQDARVVSLAQPGHTDYKKVLKKAFKDVLPERILKRKKLGWNQPGSEWLRTWMQSGIRELLGGKDLEIFERHLKGEYLYTHVWRALVYKIWSQGEGNDIDGLY